MPILRRDVIEAAIAPAPIILVGAERGTLAAVFQRPTRHNLDLRLIVQLMEAIGTVQDSGHGELLFEVAGMAHLMPKPAGCILDAATVSNLRHFLARAGWTPQGLPACGVTPVGSDRGAALMVVVDEKGGRLFHVDFGNSDPADHDIRGGGPRVVAQNLPYTLESQTLRDRTRNENEFYGKITAAIAARCPIFVVSEGACVSSAVDALIGFLRLHHPGQYKRVSCPAGTDLSTLNTAALLLMIAK